MNIVELVSETMRDNYRARQGLCIECAHTKHDNKCDDAELGSCSPYGCRSGDLNFDDQLSLLDEEGETA